MGGRIAPLYVALYLKGRFSVWTSDQDIMERRSDCSFWCSCHLLGTTWEDILIVESYISCQVYWGPSSRPSVSKKKALNEGKRGKIGKEALKYPSVTTPHHILNINHASIISSRKLSSHLPLSSLILSLAVCELHGDWNEIARKTMSLYSVR